MELVAAGLWYLGWVIIDQMLAPKWHLTKLLLDGIWAISKIIDRLPKYLDISDRSCLGKQLFYWVVPVISSIESIPLSLVFSRIATTKCSQHASILWHQGFQISQPNVANVCANKWVQVLYENTAVTSFNSSNSHDIYYKGRFVERKLVLSSNVVTKFTIVTKNDWPHFDVELRCPANPPWPPTKISRIFHTKCARIN